jgi:DNA-binding NarL/FixJ family response regulator
MNSSGTRVNVLIADSQFLITESLRYILQDERSFVVKKVVKEKSELVKAIEKEEIDLLIIDYSQTDITGINELKEIRSSFPALKILALSNIVTRSELNEYNSVGITSVILKTAEREEFFEAVDASLKGKKYYPAELLDLLFESDDRKNSYNETVQLTSSEMEIVKLISDGLTTKEIASRKFISFHTVISHRKNIFRKLCVTSVSELIMYALKSGWINIIEYHI